MENFVKYWPLILLLFAVGALKFFVEPILKKSKGETNLSEYEKKRNIFDTDSELILYNILLELFGGQYYIFPQINFSHLIKPKSSSGKEWQSLWNKIDRKSADFVFCDKQNVVPLLVIELDGGVHNTKEKQRSDTDKDNLLLSANLPLLRLKTDNLDKEFIRTQVSSALQGRAL